MIYTNNVDVVSKI